MIYKSERGQILLIVVITMIVALTVGLTIASRTVTELKISKQNEESQRAFNAAEAGIERALQEGVGNISSVEIGNNANFSVDVKDYQGLQILVNNGEQVDQDIGADVWLSSHPDFSSPIGNATLTLYWGEEEQDSCSENDTLTVAPALEVVVLNRTQETPSIAKYLYDPCGSRKMGANAPETPLAGESIIGVNFRNKMTINNTNGLIMKVIPLYNSTKVGIKSTAPLPVQGTVIESTGKSGETVRTISYYESFPQMPLELFPYSIISQ